MAKKKIKEPAKQLPRLWLDYREEHSGGDVCEGETGPWASHEDAYIRTEFIRLHREQPKHKFFNHSIEVDERLMNIDALYLAVVIYSTGSTFGHTEGAWHVVGLAPTYQVAEAMLDIALNNKDSYKPWEGYFERFTSADIHKLDVV